MTELYTPLPQQDLDSLAFRLTQHPSPHYPKDRLTLHTGGLAIRDGVLFVPDGPWETRGHPNRSSVPADQILHPELPINKEDIASFQLDPALTAGWLRQGYLVDQYGRPIIPQWRTYLSDPRLGLTTGPGLFWRYGNNGGVDALVSRTADDGESEWLMVQRRDTGEWATPGGYIDNTDKDAIATALRELGEETGLRIAAARYGARVLLRIFEVSRRVTLNSWSEINAILVEGDEELLHEAQVKPGDDVQDVVWATYDYAKSTLHMSDHYLRYIEAAHTVLTRERS